MPDIDVPQPRKAIDVLVAVRIPEVDALSAVEDQRPLLPHLLEVGNRVEKVRLILGDELGGVVNLCDGHC